MDTQQDKETTMPLIEIHRVKIDPARVERLLEIHDAAVAEFQGQVPELLSGELVRLADDVWLHVLRWSAPVGDERLEAAGACTPTAGELHEIMAEAVGHDRGEVVHTAGGVWATAR
jgi:hypothetical protein